LLPHIPAGSKLDDGSRRCLTNCQSPARPEHRRLDPGRVAVRCFNRRATVSIAVRMAGSDYE